MKAKSELLCVVLRETFQVIDGILDVQHLSNRSSGVQILNNCPAKLRGISSDT